MTSKTTEDIFDIIIVGGGTAGSLLTSRLSTNPTLRILVLEAGSNHNDDPNVRTPGYSGRLLGNPDFDWQFQSSPEEGLNGRVILQPRGKLWGGSSAINSHALVYPSRAYHDAWNSLLSRKDEKCVRWDWEGIGTYYRAFRRVQLPSEEVKRELKIADAGLENADGQEATKLAGNESRCFIQASFPGVTHLLSTAWVDTIQDIGFCSSENPADGNVIGGSITTNAIDTVKGERSHAGIAFLEPTAERENVVIHSNVLVEKILFNDETQNGELVAKGVLYNTREGIPVIVHARREVIICAGTFRSPKILELSGIRSRKHLEAARIECLYDLPDVGENLQDHLNFGPSVEVHDNIETSDTTTRNPDLIKAAEALYHNTQTGPLSQGPCSFSYLPLHALSHKEEEDDLKVLVEKALQETSSTTTKRLNAQYNIIRKFILDPNEATATTFMTRNQRYTPPTQRAPGNYMTLLAMLSYPFSRGTSHIQSADAKNRPEIKFNYLQHPLDVEILSRHMIQIGRMLKEPHLAEHLKPEGNTLPSGYTRYPNYVKEVEGHLRQFGATNYHPAGTCAMMDEELGGVVNAELKVYGTANVRVCDASIIPIIPRGNILSTIYAIAGKGADILREALKRE